MALRGTGNVVGEAFILRLLTASMLWHPRYSLYADPRPLGLCIPEILTAADAIPVLNCSAPRSGEASGTSAGKSLCVHPARRAALQT